MFARSLLLLLIVSCSEDTTPKLTNGDEIVSVNGVAVKTKEELQALQLETVKKVGQSRTPQYMTVQVKAKDGKLEEKKVRVPRLPPAPPKAAAPAATETK